jgi:4-amino-4-deoxy-L-arabinose transferase-like glycosyltransferase
MREGLYWLAMLTAVYWFWESARRRSLLLGLLAGLAATFAMLTRIEGIAIFPLGVMWCLSAWFVSSRNRRETIRLAAIALLSCAVLPLTILILNLTLLPQGSEWQGIGRFEHLVRLFMEQLDESDESRSRRVREQDRGDGEDDATFQLASFETFRVSPPPSEKISTAAEASPSSMKTIPTNVAKSEETLPARKIGAPRNVRDLAKSLPVWDKECVADPDWYRLQRFLVMADDQSEAVYLGVFANRLIQGFLVPVLVVLYYGLRYQRGRYWQGTRDWPLVFQTVLLFGVFYFHLTTEHILEPRYLFCLIPFVFPWTAIGTAMLLDRFRSYLIDQERVRLYPRIVGMVFLLTATAAVVHSAPRNDIEKNVQKQMGEHIRAHDGYGRRMVAPESLKRMAYYADAWYFMLPREVSEIGPWLQENPMDYIVLGGKELPLYSRLLPQLETHPGYERIFTEDKRFRRYFIYRSKSLGSFSAPAVAAENKPTEHE